MEICQFEPQQVTKKQSETLKIGQNYTTTRFVNGMLQMTLNECMLDAINNRNFDQNSEQSEQSKQSEQSIVDC